MWDPRYKLDQQQTFWSSQMMERHTASRSLRYPPVGGRSATVHSRKQIALYFTVVSVVWARLPHYKKLSVSPFLHGSGRVLGEEMSL